MTWYSNNCVNIITVFVNEIYIKHPLATHPRRLPWIELERDPQLTLEIFIQPPNQQPPLSPPSRVQCAYSIIESSSRYRFKVARRLDWRPGSASRPQRAQADDFYYFAIIFKMPLHRIYEPEVFESEFLIVVMAMDVISSSDIGDHILAWIRGGAQQIHKQLHTRAVRVNLGVPSFSLFLAAPLATSLHCTIIIPRHRRGREAAAAGTRASYADGSEIWGLLKSSPNSSFVLFSPLLMASHHRTSSFSVYPFLVILLCWSSSRSLWTRRSGWMRMWNNNRIITLQVAGWLAKATRCLFIMQHTGAWLGEQLNTSLRLLLAPLWCVACGFLVAGEAAKFK